MRLKEKILGLSKYAIATSFLAMEVFAFIAFSFGSSFVLYGSLSLALLLILILFSIREIKVRGITDIIFLIFPALMFGLVTALGVYMRGHASIGDFSIAEIVFVPITMVSMVGCGYLLAINKTFNIKIFLMVIFGALAILSLINLMANIINFGAFYTLRFKGYYMYFAGKRSSVPVNDLAYTLQGFKFIEAKMEHYVLYPALLLTSGFMLFKLSFKENKKQFLVFLAYVIIALLSLLLIPSKIGLIAIGFLVAIMGIMFLYYKVKGSRKVLRIIMIVGIVGACLLFLAMLLNNQSFASGISNIIANNSLLNRLFNTNAIVSRYNIMLKNVIGSNFLGFVTYQEGLLTPVLVNYSGSIFFDTFMTSGVIGVVCIAIIAIYSLKNFKKLFVEDELGQNIKATLLGIVLFYFLFCALFYNGEYGVFYYFNTPYYMSGPFLIVLFIFAYVLSRRFIKEPTPKKEKEASATNETI